MDPATLSILSTVVGVTSAVSESKAQASAYENQANAADQNAKIAGKQAEISAQNGAEQEKLMRQRGAAVAGSQKAGFAASGLDSAAGSPLDVLTDTYNQNELDALAIRKNSANQVWGLQANQTNYNNQASAARSSAKNAKTAGMIKAAGSVLSGVTSYQDKFGKKKP